MQKTIEQIEAEIAEAQEQLQYHPNGSERIEGLIHAYQRCLSLLTSQTVQEDKTAEERWPDEVRLKMIEKSEFYPGQEKVYQYGYYDGYQKGREYCTIREQKAVDVALQLALKRGKVHNDSHEIEPESILELQDEALTLLKYR